MHLKLILPLIALIVSTACGPAAGASKSPLVSPLVMAKTEKVHFCEENVVNGWHVNGSEYQGGLGWLHQTWLEWRAPSFPLNAALATPEQQAWAMERFVGAVLHGRWPDQLQCTGGY